MLTLAAKAQQEGHMRVAAGHAFDTPVLDYVLNYITMCIFIKMYNDEKRLIFNKTVINNS